ncbi:glycerol kinase [Thecamonas trahens ATCC 50062]|uniref:glycerol kinase n=1 Tax=Thecamonas trahens ATCC 50062 TaxID=461836 RepID=A0A0L0DGJ4_THETB|nr:glycerol kinase [Thecamonas trahens ATCC 50062]KNC51310.1 glycerol kinase [Thecamonas trahens ATCC 50062]|eukprot:XP_013756232.1 glycerol kinase [Thecamonas trahens ATCC 50062]
MADQKYAAALDVGTSSVRFIVFQHDGTVAASVAQEVPTATPQPGWVEQDAEAVLQACVAVMAAGVAAAEAEASIAPEAIGCVGVTNHRESTVAWSAASGQPLAPMIIWSDVRTAAIVDRIAAEAGGERALAAITGLPMSTYFSAFKMRWLLENVPAVADAAADGDLRLSTVDAFVIARLTSGDVYVSDVTNASRTCLMDLSSLKWSSEALELFDLPPTALPTIVSSAEEYGRIDPAVVPDLAHVPLAGCLGDQQAALVGQRCFAAGLAKNTYGTGCFMLLNVGTTPRFSSAGLLGTVAYQLGPDAPVHYALEGSVAVAGLGVRWARDNLGIIDSPKQINELATAVDDTAGVVFVPAFSGLLRRTGLRTLAAHIARAILEAPCFRTAEVLVAMAADAPDVALSSLRVDGGMAASDLLLQTQADLIGIPVERPAMLETTALGAAFAAGLATGVWASPDAFAAATESQLTIVAPSYAETDSVAVAAIASRKAAWTHAVAQAKLPADYDEAASDAIKAQLADQIEVAQALQLLLASESEANNEYAMTKVPELEAQVAAARREADALRSQVATADASAREVTAAKSELEARLEVEVKNVAQLTGQVEAQSQVLAALAARYKALEKEAGEHRTAAADAAAAVDRMTAELETAARAVHSANKDVVSHAALAAAAHTRALVALGGLGVALTAGLGLFLRFRR